jgi:hypothetical protein
MQAQGAVLGADALVRVRTSWQMTAEMSYSKTVQTDYGLPAGPAGATANPADRIPWVTGLAVKFVEGGETP